MEHCVAAGTWFSNGHNSLQSSNVLAGRRKLECNYGTCSDSESKGTCMPLEIDVNRLEQERQVSCSAYANLLRQCSKSKNLFLGKRVLAHLKSSPHVDNVFLKNLVVHMYSSCGALDEAHSIFKKIRNKNVFSWNIMIAGYLQSGKLENAEDLFNRMPCRDVVSWNAMIAAYARNGASEMALSIFKQMQGEVVTPNELTFRSALGACTNTIALAEGKRIHAHVVLQLDLVLRTALVKMYGRCGNVDEAWLVFVRPPVEDLVLWTAMLAAYAHCGFLEDAMIIFEMIPEPDVVCWSAIIGAHAQHGCAMDALHLFHKMQLHGLSPNKVTFISILNAYASLAALDEGRWIHGQIYENRLFGDIVVDNALVNMYGKCGSIIDARNVFNGMSKRDVISWSAIIAAYAQHGYGRESLELFQNMQQEGFMPDNILLGSILSACSHAGHLDHGFHFFLFMSKEYWIAPTVEHHNCFIDLLGRSGMLENAEDLINHMVMEPSATTWMAMLGASVVHRDARNARQAAKHVSSLDPGTIAPYVLLSNMYAAIGWWEDLVKVRRMINNKTVNNVCWEDLD